MEWAGLVYKVAAPPSFDVKMAMSSKLVSGAWVRGLCAALHSSAVFSRGSRRCTSSLPWSEILPYRSVKIDLVSAWRQGWRLEAGQEFASLLHSELHQAKCFTDNFADSAAHFQQWRAEGRSGVWLHLPLSLAHLATEAVAAGFFLHHASHETLSIVLSAWLEEESPSRLPHYASHQVGVSGEQYIVMSSISCSLVPVQVWCTGRTHRRSL